MLSKNVATWDRILRLACGLVLLVLGWHGGGVMSSALRVLALFPLITGVIGWCPVYELLRFGTR